MCEKRKLRINESKSKVMTYSRLVDDGRLNVALNGKLLQEVEYFEYLGSRIVIDGEAE